MDLGRLMRPSPRLYSNPEVLYRGRTPQLWAARQTCLRLFQLKDFSVLKRWKHPTFHTKNSRTLISVTHVSVLTWELVDGPARKTAPWRFPEWNKPQKHEATPVRVTWTHLSRRKAHLMKTQHQHNKPNSFHPERNPHPLEIRLVPSDSSAASLLL